MIQSEVSHLQEQVDPDLVSDRVRYTVVVRDGNGLDSSSFEVSQLVQNPYDTDPSRFLPGESFMDLNRFYEIAAEIIADAQAREDKLEDERVILVQDFQPEEFHSMGDEVIAVRVLKREPAKMNTKGTGRVQRASSFSHSVRSNKYPNKTIIVESRPIDHKIEFSCWAKTATLANNRALWLEKLFVRHSWAFNVQGVERFFWEGRGPDTLWKHGEQRLHQRMLTFFVRLREFEAFAHSNITNFNFTVSTEE